MLHKSVREEGSPGPEPSAGGFMTKEGGEGRAEKSGGGGDQWAGAGLNWDTGPIQAKNSFSLGEEGLVFPGEANAGW